MSDHHKSPAPDKAADAELGFDLPRVERSGLSPRVVVVLALGLVAIAIAFVVGYLPKRAARLAASSQAQSDDADRETLRVIAQKPKESSSDRAVALPGSTAALEETLIYPRTSGYIRRWAVDIGDKVKEGDLLAEIDTPELDRQIEAARADLLQTSALLVQAKANQKLAHVTDERTRKLAPAGLATQQEADEKQAAASVADANVGVAEATASARQAALSQLLATKAFARVMAPFAGTITARTVERGSLVTSGNSTSLFRLVATETMRIYVQVPQDLAVEVRPGLAAKVSIREFPGRTFEGKVAHTQSALDAQSRTMTAEVRVPNADGALLSGMYANVAFALHGVHRAFIVPSSALIADSKGVRVAVVNDSRIAFVPVVIEHDDGDVVWIASGLTGQELVVKNPGSQAVEGRAVTLLAPPPAPPASSAK
jgi:RND family efflux transporter MFP subunit